MARKTSNESLEGPGESAGPRVSVVIPCFNAADVVEGQLAALAAQRNAPEFEVLVVDNRSTDDLAAVVSAFSDRLALRLVSATERPGVCHARNRGVLAAEAPTVLICDADDEVGDVWVARMAQAVGDGGVLAAATLDYERLNEPLIRRVLDGEGRWEPAPYMDYLPFAFGCGLGISRQDYLAVGGMDESIAGGSDDVDFAWRAQEAGIELIVVPDAVVHYRLRSEPKAVARQRRGYQRGDVLVWARSRTKGRPVGGKSFKWSLGDALRALLRGVSYPVMDRSQRLAWARHVGGALGALEGHLRYRILGRAPGPILINGPRDDA